MPEARREIARTKLIICHLDFENKQFFLTKININIIFLSTPKIEKKDYDSF